MCSSPMPGYTTAASACDSEPGELLECLRLVLDVDVIGYALAAQAAAPALRASRGHVVLTLSDASFLVGQQGAGLAYTAAKHAAFGLLGWLARRWRRKSVSTASLPGAW